MLLGTPADLGYEDAGYKLLKLHIIEHVIETMARLMVYSLILPRFAGKETGARRESVNLRADKAAEIMRKVGLRYPWCNLNDESELITDLVDGAMKYRSMTPDEKGKVLIGSVMVILLKYQQN